MLTGAAAADDVGDLYRSRLVELDNAIAELLDGEPVDDTLRRTGSARRRSDRRCSESLQPYPDFRFPGTSAALPLRRSRSERRGTSRRSSKNL